METAEQYQVGQSSDQESKSDTRPGPVSTIATDEESPSEGQMAARHYQKIIDLQAECDRLEAEFDSLHELAKDAKKRLEMSVNDLRSVIRRGPSRQGEFEFAESDQPSGMSESDSGDLEHDARMGYPISAVLSCTAKQQEMLDYAGIHTVADFERVRGGRHSDYPGGLSDLPRVGQATIDKWENSVIEWLAGQ